MNAILPWLLLNTLTLAVLIPLVALACRLFSQRPAVQHLLWAVVLIKFLTPPLVVWPWAIDAAIVPQWMTARPYESLARSQADFTAASTIDQAARSTDSTVAETSSQRAADAAMASQLKLAELAALAAALEKDQASVAEFKSEVQQADIPAQQLRSRWAVSWLLTGIWLFGAGVYAVRQARRIARHRRFLHEATPAARHLHDAVDAIAAQMDLRAPAVWQSATIGSPFIWCLGRLRLVWPTALAAPQQVWHARGAIAHELAHIRRHDHHVAWLELAAAVVWWWNPLFWYARRRLREAAEMSCDALAIAAFPEERSRYAQLLLELSSVGAGKLPAPVLAIGAGSSKSFERRFTMILSDRATSQVSVCGILTAVCLAVLAIPGWAIGQAPTAAEKPATTQPSAGNSAPVAEALATEAPATKIDPPAAASNPNQPTAEAPAAVPTPPAAAALPGNAGNAETGALQRIKALETENKRLLDLLQAIQQGNAADKERLIKRWSGAKPTAKPATNKEGGYRPELVEYTPPGEATKKLNPEEAYQRAIADLKMASQRLEELRNQERAPAEETLIQAEHDVAVVSKQLAALQDQVKQDEAGLQKSIAVKRASERAFNGEQLRAAQQAKAIEAQAQEAMARGKLEQARAIRDEHKLQVGRAVADTQQDADARVAVNKNFALPAAANPLDIAERYLRAEADLKTAKNKLTRIKQMNANGLTSQETIDDLQIELERAEKLCRLLAAYLDEALRGAQVSRTGVQNEYQRTEELAKKGAISRSELEIAKVRLEEADSVIRQYETIHEIVPAAK